MDQSLIPLDQEYGNRKQTVDLMRQAGQSAAQTPTPVTSSPGVGAAASPTDFLMARKPSYPQDYQAPDPLARLRNLAQTSPNSLVRGLLKEMLQ